MADAAAYDPLGAAGTWRRNRAKLVVYALLSLFALYYLLAARRRGPQFLPRSSGHQPQRPDRSAAQLFARILVGGLESNFAWAAPAKE